MSYVRNLFTAIGDYLWDNQGIDLDKFTEDYKKLCKSSIDPYLKKHRTIMDDEGHTFLTESITKFLLDQDITLSLSKVYKLEDLARRKTEMQTFQAMEAMVHNLNTMQCFPGYEDLWVYDLQFNQWCIYTFEQLHRIFTKNRFFVMSVNQTTGALEMKPILDCVARENDKDMIAVVDASGSGYVSTYDHRFMTSNPDLTLGYTQIFNATHTTMPRKFEIPTFNHDTGIDVSEFSARGVSVNTPCIGHTFIPYSIELAEILGYWVADGWISPDMTMMGFAVDIKVSSEYLTELFEKAFGFAPKARIRNRIDSKGEERLHALMLSVGVHIGRAILQLCGHRADTKHIPNFVLTGPVEFQNAFLRAYFICDGGHHDNFLDFSTVSSSLVYDMRLLFLSRGEVLHVGCKTNGVTPTGNAALPLYTGMIGGKAAERMGLGDLIRTATEFEIPKYDNSDVTAYAKSLGISWGTDFDRVTRRAASPALNNGRQMYYHEINELVIMHPELRGIANLVTRTHVFNMPIIRKNNAPAAEIVYDISVADNENFMLANGAIVHNSRAGSQTPFSSVNFGTDTSWEGRLVSKCTMQAFDKGLGKGETAIFPIAIFRMKKGITDKGSPNYDLFKMSCEISAKRLFPNWVNVDAPYNLKYYKPEDPRTQIAAMGCRTRVISNVYDPKHEICYGRGNLFWTTLNLPYIALEVKESLEKVSYPDGYSKQWLIDAFFKRLDQEIDDILDFSRDRLRIISKRKAFNYPFAMGQHEYVDSEKLNLNDSIEEVIKQGTISVGFIGLAETLIALIGKHHGESEEAQELGLKIVSFMRARMDQESKNTNMNYSLMATPAEGCTGRLCKLIAKRFGIIPGITDKKYLVNSSHVPPKFHISVADKIRIEAPYHELENAGHIFYCEQDADISKNPEALEDIVTMAADAGCGYIAVNHPVTRDPVCGYVGPLNPDGTCPRCGRKEYEGVTARKLLNLTAYSPDPEYAVTSEKLEDEDKTINDL